jgi:hypothetical protein
MGLSGGLLLLLPIVVPGEEGLSWFSDSANLNLKMLVSENWARSYNGILPWQQL